ncbi:PH domain-containing protein [Marmoricola sp. RAF53]|uniref:PH domain-containing protein n=1 Tax=Marmoricola sp. RAF53 TaxID=3233059 RepID=UPI003F98EE73
MADSAPVLRDPANLVSPRARLRWRIGAGILVLVGVGVLVGVTVATDAAGWWLWWPAYLVLAGAYLVLMPRLRYATHRWETTPTAIYTQTGWIGRTREIAPMSRVQTVEFHQGVIDRMLGLATVSVSTASDEDLTIELLDRAVAEELTARLTAAAEAEVGDAT